MATCEKTPLLEKKLDLQSSTEIKKEGICSLFGRFLKNFRVEPVAFFHAFYYAFDSVFLTNLFVDKVCDIKLNFSSEICNNLDSGDYPDEQDEVQQIVTLYGMYQQFIVFIPMIFSVLILSGWSESHGVKASLIITNLGYTIKSILLAACSYWWFLSPNYVLWSLFPAGLGGGMCALFMSIFSYISLKVDEKSRTTRIAMILVIENSMASVGIILATLIFEKYGYLGIFGIQAALSFLCVLYVIIFLDNPIPKQKHNVDKASKSLISGMKNTLTVAFKKREDGGRAKVISHIIVIALYICMLGVTNFYILYTRKKFSWEFEDYSYWKAFSSPWGVIGTLVILPLLSSVLKLEDTLLSLIGMISAMFTYTLQATAPRGWVMYLASALGVGGSMVFAASRSALSKTVGPDEISAVFGIVSLAESTVPLLDNPVLTAIYYYSIDFFPGMVFAVAAVLGCIGACIATWVYTRYPEKKDVSTSTDKNI